MEKVRAAKLSIEVLIVDSSERALSGPPANTRNTPFSCRLMSTRTSADANAPAATMHSAGMTQYPSRSTRHAPFMPSGTRCPVQEPAGQTYCLGRQRFHVALPWTRNLSSAHSSTSTSIADSSARATAARSCTGPANGVGRR